MDVLPRCASPMALFLLSPPPPAPANATATARFPSDERPGGEVGELRLRLRVRLVYVRSASMITRGKEKGQGGLLLGTGVSGQRDIYFRAFDARLYCSYMHIPTFILCKVGIL